MKIHLPQHTLILFIILISENMKTGKAFAQTKTIVLRLFSHFLGNFKTSPGNKIMH